jgi:hypothetical protein
MIIVFLYNKERIILEGLQLAKLRISKALGLSENIVGGNFKNEDGKLIPCFEIDKQKVPLSKLDDLEDIMKREWEKTLKDINSRLENFEKGTNKR